MPNKQLSLSPRSWVLVTGVNGYVASHIAKQLLQRGFRVRGTVRDLDRTAWLVKDAFKRYADNGDFDLIAIKNFTAEGVYDSALEGVSAIAHVASVVTFDSDPAAVIPKTVDGALRILEAALKVESIKSVVYTSSVVAATMPVPGNTSHVDGNTWNDVATELAWSPRPHDASHGGVVYMASKVEAEKAVWKFVKDNNPHFRVNSVAPGMIMGELLSDAHLHTAGSWVKQLWDGDVTVLSGFPASKLSAPSSAAYPCAILASR